MQGQSETRPHNTRKDTEGQAGDENTISPVSVSGDIVAVHVTGRKYEISVCAPIAFDQDVNMF